MTKVISKIHSIKLGSGGYQDAMFGVTFDFGLNSDFRGTWGMDTKPPTNGAWDEISRKTSFAETLIFIAEIMIQAKVTDFNDLVNKPVEITYYNDKMSSWRILTEAI